MHLKQTGYIRSVKLLFFTFFSLSAYGQADLLSKNQGKYFYKERVYKCVELGVVYKEHKESLDIYKSSIKMTNVANLSAFIGLPLFLGGIGWASSDENRGLGAVAMGSAVLLELLAIIPRVVGAYRLTKARRTFNYEMIRRHGYKEGVSISINQTPSGVGFVLSF